jgi:hypothetical protein
MNPFISGELASDRERTISRHVSRDVSGRRHPRGRQGQHRDETVFRSSPSSDLA